MDRVACINPRCNRTFKREGAETEVICGKCFKLCPVERKRYKRLMKFYRHSQRYPHKWPAERLDLLHRRLDAAWAAVKSSFYDPGRPEGIDAFLQEMGWL